MPQAPESTALQYSVDSYRVSGPLALENDGVSAHVEEAQVCRGVGQKQHRPRGYPFTDHLQHQFFFFKIKSTNQNLSFISGGGKIFAELN